MTVTPMKSKSSKFDLMIQYELPPEFYLAKFEKMYKLKELNHEQIYDCVTDFFKNVSLDPELEAIYCRKLGTWLSESLTEESQKGFDKVLGLFKKSLKLCSEEVETWHLFALTNYKRIQQITNNRERQIDPNSEQMQTLIKDSFEGFMKSISIGGPDFTEALQDTLKLLEILFKYGDQPNIMKIMNENFMAVDITCWLNVVPQLIAKLDIGNDTIFQNIMRLLEHVGHSHPGYDAVSAGHHLHAHADLAVQQRAETEGCLISDWRAEAGQSRIRCARRYNLEGDPASRHHPARRVVNFHHQA